MAAPLLFALSLAVAVDIASGPDFGLTVHDLRIATVRPAGPADRAGLRPGDHLASVGDTAVGSMHAYYAAMAGYRHLEPVVFTVTRGDATQTVVVQPARPPRAQRLRETTTWLTGLAFLAIGWWVLWQRDDLVARNFFALCLIFAFFLAEVPDHPNTVYMTCKDLLRLLAQDLLPAYFLRFLLLFPSPDRRAPLAAAQRTQRRLLLPGLVLFVATVLLDYTDPQAAGTWPHLALETATVAYALLFFIAGLAVFARRALRRDRPIQRTKMLVVLTGLVAGLAPFLATMVLVNLIPGASEGPWPTMALSLVLVPASFGLAIMRYGALDAAFVVRASLTYGLLTLLLAAAFLLVVAVVGSVLSRVFAVSAYPMLLIIAAGSSLVVGPLRRKVQDWIDRTFYPHRRLHRRAVAALGEELAGLIELDDVVAILAARLREQYRPASFVMRLGSGPGTPLSPVGPSAGGPPVPVESPLAVLLHRLRRPIFTEEAEDLLFAAGADAAAVDLLAALDSVLLLPLISGNRLVGFLSFGAKAAGGLYTQEDLAGLRGLALQVGSIVESRRLYQEVLEQERLEAELAVARDIQAHLLPTAPLVTPGYAVAGRNDPCRAVGGDYFDYFLRENGHLALAIADVAGKGVPAALLMTSLSTAFRHEAEGDDAPATVVRHLNALMSERVTPGRFVSFFFADLDPASGLVRFCNAGMDPPVVLRRDGSPHQLLRKGGPVLGAAPDHPYREGVLQLAVGDRLFLHTDGLADERNAAGEFFDTGRLLAEVATRPEGDPGAVLDQVFAAVAAFGDGAESDDKTAILLVVKKLRNSLEAGPLLAQSGWDAVDARGLPGAR